MMLCCHGPSLLSKCCAPGSGKSQRVNDIREAHAARSYGCVMLPHCVPFCSEPHNVTCNLSLVQVVDDILDITQTTEQLGKTAGKDLASSKTTYPALLGLDESKRIAQQLIADAKDALSMYDQTKAGPLLGLADYIGSRTN